MVSNIKVILYGVLFAFSFLLWQSWHKSSEKHQQTLHASSQHNANTLSELPSSLPKQHDIPASSHSVKSNGQAITQNHIQNNQVVQINTPLYQGKIDLKGGALVGLKLKEYPVSLQQKDTPFVLLSNNPHNTYVAQSGLLSNLGPDSYKNNSTGVYTVSKHRFDFNKKSNTLEVPLSWSNQSGITVIKTYVFKKDSYVIDVNYKIINKSNKNWTGSLFAQLKRSEPQAKQSHFLGAFPTYTGAAVSTPDKPFHKIAFKDMKKSTYEEQVKQGWIAMIQHYFLTAWVPTNKQQNYMFSSQVIPYDNPAYIIQLVGPKTVIKPGQVKTESLKLYAGPEETDKLAKIAPGLELTVDYGWLSPISQGLFWLMKKIHLVVGNWGLAIILVTLLIKLAFYRLSATSYRSMANMKKLQPKIEMLKKRHGDDKTKMSQEMMALYKKEKVNPLGGCLPMLIQIPFFIALYWVLIESVELRQAPFYFWIHDLSVKDPFYILPIIMGLSMLLQQKMAPAPADPTQAKMMLLMPIVFTFLFLNFPAGLMLYWIFNNLLSVLQQWVITKRIENNAASYKKVK